jgi:hypothetical protein
MTSGRPGTSRTDFTVEEARAAILVKPSAGGETALRLIGSKFDGNLAAYTVGRPMTPTTTVFNCSLFNCSLSPGGPVVSGAATGAAASALVNVDEVDANVLAARQRADDGTQSRCGAPQAADDLADVVPD